MLPVELSRLAQIDLTEILTYVKEQSASGARNLAKAINNQGEMLSRMPDIGSDRGDLAPDLRSVIVKNYILFYRILTDRVQIVRILHSARDIDNIMSKH